jgi:hypothetical protein
MKKILYLVSLTWGAAVVYSGRTDSERWSIRDQEDVRRTLTLTGEPNRVLIDNLDGSVHVRGTNGNQVRVSAHKTIRAETDSDMQTARSEVKLEMSEKPGTAIVYYDAPWRCQGEGRNCHGEYRRFYRVTYDIDVEVPRDARTAISTVNNGDVRVEDIAGPFDVGNVNGGINMTGIGGSGDVHTVNGPIHVGFVRHPSTASSFKTVNGTIDVFFPPGLSADLRFKTFNGGIYTDFDVQPQPVAPTSPDRRNGRYVYRSNQMRAAVAGRGGPELSFNSLNGDIRLHQNSGDSAKR